jgi:tetratricopeptide (TPR) repeat protein
MAGLLSNPFVPWIAAAVVLYVLYRKLGHKLHIKKVDLSMDGILGRVLGKSYTEAKWNKYVAQLKKSGNYLAAGKAYEDLGQDEKAVAVYLEGEETWAAAATLERLGRLERAAELYVKTGDYKKAGQVFLAAGRGEKAAALFEERGNNLEAARLYAESNKWEKASALFEKSGYPERAGAAYEKHGAFLKAAECYERHFMENVSYGTTYSSTAASADQKSALKAGQLYEKAGELDRALQILARGEYHVPAARVATTLGQHKKAAELYLKAEKTSEAAEAFERAGEKVKAANLRGEVAFKQGLAAEAAAHFQAGEDYLRAAELFEGVGMLAEAAGAFEAGHSFASAGAVYVRAGLKDRAAAAYESAGEYETAAKLYDEIGNTAKSIELFSKAGLTFRGGKAAFKAGEIENAIALLQRVPPSDENFQEATLLLVQMFVEASRPGLAVERLQKVLAGQEASPENIDLYYWYGVAHERCGHVNEATDLYKKILAEDFQHRDVQARLAALQSSPSAAQRPSPPGIPPGGAVPAPVAVRATPASASPGPAAPLAPAPPPEAAPLAPAQAASSRAAPAPSSPFVPRQEIGRGPLGQVFRGEDQRNGKAVALRLLPAGLVQDATLFRALVADLKAASQVLHPGLVRVLGVADVKGQRCVVTDYVAGQDCAGPLEKGRRMPLAQVLNLGGQLASALQAVHGRGLAHGSVQPSNVLITSGKFLLADLGLGRAALRLSPGHHRAPEAKLDAAGDIYSLAALLYHLLTGRRPQVPGLEPASRLVPGTPAGLDTLLERGLSQAPPARIGSAALFAEEIGKLK